MPVLMYHEIRPAGSCRHPYDVDERRFREQLAWLRDQGLRGCTLDAYRRGGAWERDVAITFDDAQLTNLTVAAPALAEFGFRATFFIPTAFLGRDAEQLEGDQLAELCAAGMSVQSHGHTHRFLSELGGDALRDELRRSRELLEEHTGRPVDALACPGGRCSRAVLAAAGETGYRVVCTSRPGSGRLRGSEPQVVDRCLVQAGTSAAEFATIARGDRWGLAQKRVFHGLKSAARTVLGHSAYHAAWRRLRRAPSAGPGANDAAGGPAGDGEVPRGRRSA